MPNNSAGPGRPKDLSKRLAILEAARTLFLDKGFANTNMDTVASNAGVSKLTVYSHFNDKETLFSAAVVATCQAQLPELLFELRAGSSVHKVLMDIGLAFVALINCEESVKLHRLIIALGTQDEHLSRIFYEAGPQRILGEMEGLLRRIDESGALRIDTPATAAEHFFYLLKGAANFRLLLGCAGPLAADAARAHVEDVVGVFERAYRL